MPYFLPNGGLVVQGQLHTFYPVVFIHGQLTRNGEQSMMHVYGITISLLWFMLTKEEKKQVVLDTHFEDNMTCGLS